MSSNTLFDVLMEIRKIERQISEEKVILEKNQGKVIALERDIVRIQDLQLKASSVLKNAQTKSIASDTELKFLHKSYNKFIQSVNECKKNFQCEKDIVNNELDDLKKYRDRLKEESMKVKAKCDEIAQKLNDVDLQVTIQKKKNAATQLRLQKNLEESLDIESSLTDTLKSRSIQ
ncbi:hypothetical protein QAD02_022126 [Eretmocerus hayati]|uniref:Uncharacterized protein n=1 Tax=Eretmocerus hayati TaxID=131215 RepID=A0ACC2PSD7_9HYME|nr:hypothetical protein QAD02_022126 [Eretmocerus hayati]